ncbi:MAG: hypothetical protein IJ239_04715 [Eubacterium sp.]|nr:hypothetical protein [Eubacterium sp.]
MGNPILSGPAGDIQRNPILQGLNGDLPGETVSGSIRQNRAMINQYLRISSGKQEEYEQNRATFISKTDYNVNVAKQRNQVNRNRFPQGSGTGLKSTIN